jgi:flagellar basal-body rod modification protein FlgD
VDDDSNQEIVMLNPVPQLGPPPATPPANSVSAMTSSDFLKLLLTQLQSQDPTEPVKNQDLLNQVTSIRSLQSNLDLSTTMTAMGKQQQIASAGALIGKHVEGLNSTAESVNGTVTSITVQQNSILLDLDNGQQVDLTNVTKVSQVGATSTTTGN